ncbi:hypothetical protein C8R46DRAFT_1219116 [Mycena filopes]|nr:hypothetical protein C8R46DRAFT_1219116 [Mycena filopes]
MHQTYHKGLHAVPRDQDDAPAPTPSATPHRPPDPPASSKPSPSASAPPPPPRPPTPPDDGDDKPAGDDDDKPTGDDDDKPPGDDDDKPPGNDDDKTTTDGDDGKGLGKGGSGQKDADDIEHGVKRRQLPRMDADDPGFVDNPVFAHFNFTGVFRFILLCVVLIFSPGTAVYIFCIQPLGLVTSPAAPPSLMNVSFSLDGALISTFVHQGSPTASGFSASVNVFAKSGLVDGPHALQLSLAPKSVFILDYMVVTQNAEDIASSSSSSIPTSLAVSSPTSTPGDNGTTTKKGRATFAAAVASSLGILGILCFGTAFSIYRRRQLAARRERLERGTTPPMTGPGFFTPRYFPGTVVPSAPRVPNVPPPYAPSSTTSPLPSSSSSSSSSTSSLSHAHGTGNHIFDPLLPMDRTYADIPPPLDEIAPPSFGVAITTPAVTLLTSDDVAVPPPRPQSWGPGAASQLPPRVGFSEEEEHDEEHGI